MAFHSRKPPSLTSSRALSRFMVENNITPAGLRCLFVGVANPKGECIGGGTSGSARKRIAGAGLMDPKTCVITEAGRDMAARARKAGI